MTKSIVSPGKQSSLEMCEVDPQLTSGRNTIQECGLPFSFCFSDPSGLTWVSGAGQSRILLWDQRVQSAVQAEPGLAGGVTQGSLGLAPLSLSGWRAPLHPTRLPCPTRPCARAPPSVLSGLVPFPLLPSFSDTQICWTTFRVALRNDD